MWNLLNGLNLHKLETVSNAEVTGVICHHDNQLLATGWSRLIAQYSIAFSDVRASLCLNHTHFNGYLKAKRAFSQNTHIKCIFSGSVRLCVHLWSYLETSITTKWVLMVVWHSRTGDLKDIYWSVSVSTGHLCKRRPVLEVWSSARRGYHGHGSLSRSGTSGYWELWWRDHYMEPGSAETHHTTAREVSMNWKLHFTCLFEMQDFTY